MKHIIEIRENNSKYIEENRTKYLQIGSMEMEMSISELKKLKFLIEQELDNEPQPSEIMKEQPIIK